MGMYSLWCGYSVRSGLFVIMKSMARLTSFVHTIDPHGHLAITNIKWKVLYFVEVRYPHLERNKRTRFATYRELVFQPARGADKRTKSIQEANYHEKFANSLQ